MPTRITFLLVFCSIYAFRADADDAEFSNRLAKESSPYLLQHAHNPVDWYPWGDEAFAKAKAEDKMVFLSVGYAACHWCHVMERESFVDTEIADFMNEHFVCIKVDREERPDVDQIYMTAVQLISRGSGGWPMSVFMVPDGRPFWGGTYFPARTGDRGNATGFLDVIQKVQAIWKDNQASVVGQAEALTEAIKKAQALSVDSKLELRPGLITEVAETLRSQFDPEYGGFGYALTQPNLAKFPEPSNLKFLLDRMNRISVDREQRERARRMLIGSLDGMISGATIDHLGGGFHRYSVDRRWQIPHFEKMLYDNGQLASVYSEAYAQTKREEYKYVAEGICDFVLRELRAPAGGFYSALDADSEGEEGKFYRWTAEELAKLEQFKGYPIFAQYYRLDQQPNFEGEFFVPDPGTPLTPIAKRRRERFVELVNVLKPARTELFNIRSRRERPLTDVKILTSWNGLMISGLADAGRILEREDYVQAAALAADFVLDKLRQSDGRLLRTYAADQAKLNAYLDDYAFMAHGLISLHRATGDQKWIKIAAELTDAQVDLFWSDPGGFYFTSKDHPPLIVRARDLVDSAVPAGVSVTAENLMYLADHTDVDTVSSQYETRLRKTMQAIAGGLERSPSSASRGAAAMAEYFDRTLLSVKATEAKD